MPDIKLGLRVRDVAQAVEFYRGLGFQQLAAVPGPDGAPVLAVLRLDDFHLIVDALVGLPFPDTERERQIKAGPRGLGCVIGLEVPDLDQTYKYCLEHGCEMATAIQDQPWGERIFTCIDPYGYEWKFAVKTGAGSAEAAASKWFGEPRPAGA